MASTKLPASRLNSSAICPGRPARIDASPQPAAPSRSARSSWSQLSSRSCSLSVNRYSMAKLYCCASRDAALGPDEQTASRANSCLHPDVVTNFGRLYKPHGQWCCGLRTAVIHRHFPVNCGQLCATARARRACCRYHCGACVERAERACTQIDTVGRSIAFCSSRHVSPGDCKYAFAR